MTIAELIAKLSDTALDLTGEMTMPKYRVLVQETICVSYDEVVIEAADADAAEKIAEEMRVQGDLGTPREAVEDVDYDIWIEGAGTPDTTEGNHVAS